MKIILMMTICEENATFKNHIQKEYHSNVIPHKGDIIQETMWDDESQFEALEVIIDYGSDLCCIQLPEKITESIDETRKLVDEAKSNKWK